MKKNYLIVLILLASFYANAQQKNVNNYKYVIVPIQFDFLKGKDTYRINTLTKYLFKEAGFEAFFDEQELPKDVFKDRCLALYADVEDLKGGFLKTNIQITLKDCYGDAVVITKIGDSKQKSRKEAYSEAIRDAFETIKGLDYRYSPKSPDKSSVKSATATTVMAKKNPEEETISEVKTSPTIKVDVENNNNNEKANPNTSILTIKPIALGYEILNNKGEVAIVLLATSSKDVFIVKGKSAIVYKTEQGTYMYSENDGTSIVQKPLQIEF